MPRVSIDELSRWLLDDTRTTYVFDVRTHEEYAQAHWPAARHAPGGQLVQTTDRFVAVRNARIVLNDDIGLRATTTAVRLRQMGHQAYVLDADARSFAMSAPSAQAVDVRDQADRFRQLATDATLILDVSRGMEYRKAHVETARWATRARLDFAQLERNDSILVTGRHQTLIDGVAADLVGHGIRAQPCIGSPDIWAAAGLNVVGSADTPSDADCIDYLFFVHDRHDGNLDAARRYLEWEVGLVAQLDEQERSVFTLR